MAAKFLINHGVLLMGNVDYHYKLIDPRKENNVSGGGRFYVDRKTNTIYFFGKSEEFGRTTQANIDAAIKSNEVERMNIVFSYEDSLEKLLPEICNK